MGKEFHKLVEIGSFITSFNMKLINIMEIQ